MERVKDILHIAETSIATNDSNSYSRNLENDQDNYLYDDEEHENALSRSEDENLDDSIGGGDSLEDASRMQKVRTLTDMGFDEETSKASLIANNWNIQAAITSLLDASSAKNIAVV